NPAGLGECKLGVMVSKGKARLFAQAGKSVSLSVGHKRHLLAGVGCIALMAIWFSSAFFSPASADDASSSSADTASASTNEAPSSMERVIVTARKRDESIIDVPLAVTSLNADRLLQTQATSITDWSTRVPGLSVNDQGNGRNNLAIR